MRIYLIWYKSRVEHVVVANCNTQVTTCKEVHKSTSLPGLLKLDIKRLVWGWGHFNILPIFDKGEKLPSSKIKVLSLGVKKLYNSRKHMTIDDDGVLYRVIHRHGREIRQLVLTSVWVLSSLHDECGHQGVERTSELVRSRCFWPSLFKDVTNYCKKCQRCRLSKEQFPKLKTKTMILTQQSSWTPLKLWDSISMSLSPHTSKEIH